MPEQLPSPARRRRVAEALALAGEWKRLDRVATAVAIVLSPRSTLKA
ncbi:MAG: hypothetical protein WKF94_00905 [Solirubrobacteraceae bacterium]